MFHHMKLYLYSAAVMAALFCSGSPSLRADAQVGQAAPPLTLKGIDGQDHSLKDYAGKFVVLEWTNPDCPFVHKHYDSHNMQKLQKEFEDQGVIWLSVCSSGPGKQGNYPAAEVKKILAEREATPTAYLIDADGRVGKAYGARSTPTMVVINPQGVVVYDGAIDSINSTDVSDIPKATNYLSQALHQSMAGQPVTVPATKAYGCSVKY